MNRKTIMTKADPYFKKIPDFAKSICKKLRALIFKAAPNIKEELKWTMPNYSINGMIFAIAAFKGHVSFTFFKGATIKDTHKIFEPSMSAYMRSVKFTAADEVNEKVMLDYIRRAIELDATGEKLEKQKLTVPSELKKQAS